MPYGYRFDETTIASHNYNINSFFEYNNIKNRQNQLDNLFNDSTILNYCSLYSGHPNKTEGYYFKRFPDINDNRVLLFVSLDNQSELEGGLKPIDMEIQVFDNKNQVVDKLIVYEVIPNECTWSRDFVYSKNNLLEIRDKVKCIDIYNDDPKTNIIKDSINIYYYQIKDNGKIVRYHELENGFYKDLAFQEEGIIKNHYKEGLWKSDVYNEDKQLREVYFTNYKDGEKHGEALYYSFTANRTFQGLQLQHAEKYENNKLIYSVEYNKSDFSEFTMSPKCDSIIETINDEVFTNKDF